LTHSSNLRLGLDLRPLQTGAGTASGIGTYCYNLVRSLISLRPERSLAYLTLGNYAWKFHELVPAGTRIHPIFRPKKPERWHSLYDSLVGRYTRIPFIDVFHLLQPSTFTVKGCRNVVTVYDLIPLRFPRVYLSAFDVRTLYYLKLKVVRKCDRIICISNSVREEVIDLLNVQADRVVAIPLGVDEEFFAAVDLEGQREFRSKFKVDRNYILSAGGLDHRKNVINAVRAFLLCPELHNDFQMVIAGKKEASFAEIVGEIQRAGKSQLFKFVGRLTLSDLRCAYQGASAFVYPSLQEGFGLPPLEAMSAGIPTITSDTSSLPEVVGDAALQVAPSDVDAIAHALRLVIGRAELRATLAAKGRVRAKEFTWHRTAALTDAVYATLA
jgi:glycosyltransferase involved in cell wall biosynthesis